MFIISNQAARFVRHILPVLVLSGCATVGPDYQASTTSAPEQWQHKVVASKNSASSIQNLSQWWVSLKDPVLTKLIAQAKHSNLDLRIAVARIDQARAQYGVTRSLGLPSLAGQGAYTREKASESLIAGATGTNDNQQVSTAFAWEVDLFGRIRRQNEAAKATLESFTEDYRDVLVVLNASIASNYIQVRTLQRRIILAEKNLANQRETLDLVRARYHSELTSELDVNQATQNLASSQSTIPLLNSALSRAMNRLAILSGLLPGQLHQDLAIAGAIPTTSEQLTLSIPRDVLRQRPDIRRAERQLAAQVAQIGVATADLYPRLSLNGIFGFASLNGGLFNSESRFWSFGPDLNWNVFSGGKVRQQIAIENARAEQARFNYEKTILLAFEDVEAGLINYQEEQRRLAYLQQSVSAAQNTVKIAKSQYRNGLTNFQTVLDAERVLFNEQDRLAESQGSLVLHLVDIYRAMGGGWQTASTANDI